MTNKDPMDLDIVANKIVRKNTDIVLTRQGCCDGVVTA